LGRAAKFADVRICVVDDNRNFQNLFRTLLRGMGFRRVDVFGDPLDARNFVTDTPVDITFVDLVMPRQSGIEWVRAVRRSTLLANPTMPITLVSGHVDRRVLEAAVNAGVDDILVKPLAPSTLYHHALRLLHHPIPYVRGPNGYFGPNLRAVMPKAQRDTPSAPAQPAAPAAHTRGRGYARSVPGLHVEKRAVPVYDGQQTFLD